MIENKAFLNFLSRLENGDKRVAAEQIMTLAMSAERWFAICEDYHALTPARVPVRRFGAGYLSFPQTVLRQAHVGVFFVNGGVARPVVQVAIVEPVNSKLTNHLQILQLAPNLPAFYWGQESFEPGLTAGMLTIRSQESQPSDQSVSPVNLHAFYYRLEEMGFF